MFSIPNILSIHCVGLKYWYTDNMKNNYELCTDLARSQTCNMKNNKSKSLLKYIYLSWYSNYRSNRSMLPQDPVQLIIVYQVKLTEPRSIILQHRGGTYITSDTANFQIAAVFQPFPRLVFFFFTVRSLNHYFQAFLNMARQPPSTGHPLSTTFRRAMQYYGLGARNRHQYRDRIYILPCEKEDIVKLPYFKWLLLELCWFIRNILQKNHMIMVGREITQKTLPLVSMRSTPPVVIVRMTKAGLEHAENHLLYTYIANYCI